jgi:phage baseplate assembly protein gpV
VIPRQNEVSITLDQTFLELYKDDGAVAVTATLVNGSAADYNSITWTAPKVGGQVIVSVSKANGKTCNIVPRAVGRTTLRAQLPNGKYADCIVSVSSAAEIIFDTQAVHVNPGYTETITYRTNPESAQVNWVAQSNTAADAAEYFTFQVNEAAKTIAVTGVALGGGSLNAFFVSSSGGTTARIQVYVEYTYEFALHTSGILTAEPRSGNTITIPFRVFPTDLEVTAAVSDPHKMEVKSVSLNTVTGNGEVVITPLGEKNGLFVTLQAVNPKDRVNTPIIRTQYINLRYQNLTITPVFDLEAGAFPGMTPALILCTWETANRLYSI